MAYNKIHNEAFIELVEDTLFSHFVSDYTKVVMIMDFLVYFTNDAWDIDTAIANQRIPFVNDPLFEQAYTEFKKRS